MPSVGGVDTSVRKVQLKDGVRYQFQWWNWVAVAKPDGTVARVRQKHTERRHTEREAETYRRVIIGVHSRGEHFVPGSQRAVARLRDVAVAYAAATPNEQTRRFRTAMMNRMLAALGDAALVSDLSITALRRVAEVAKDDGLKEPSRVVGEVERLWAWADGQDCPGVPRPKRIVGTEVPTREPVYATAVATLDDCDAMIAHLSGWHQRVAIWLRYTGLRVSQVLTLERSDFDLDIGWLRLRSSARGAKGGRYRVVPLHPGLIDEIHSWELPSRGPLFFSTDVRRPNGPGPWTADTLCEPFKRAWRLAGVAEAKWGAPAGDAGGRVHARPTHAFRGALKTHLMRHADIEIANLLIGHANTHTHDAYVVQGDPTGSPYWARMLAALDSVPHRSRGATVIPLRGGA